MNLPLDKKIKENLASLGKEFKLDLVILFGSRAKGTNRENSDYDIAVFSREGIDKKKEYNIFKKLQIIFEEKEFDLCNLNEIHSVKLRYTIFKEGLPTFQSDKRILIEKYNESFFDYVDFQRFSNLRKEALLS